MHIINMPVIHICCFECFAHMPAPFSSRKSCRSAACKWRISRCIINTRDFPEPTLLYHSKLNFGGLYEHLLWSVPQPCHWASLPGQCLGSQKWGTSQWRPDHRDNTWPKQKLGQDGESWHRTQDLGQSFETNQHLNILHLPAHKIRQQKSAVPWVPSILSTKHDEQVCLLTSSIFK